MKIWSECRICLSGSATKDIFHLKLRGSDKTYSEILLFCLDIQVDNDSKISTRLCMKCFRKIMNFYNFKLLAHKSESYLRNLESESIIKTESIDNGDRENEEKPQGDSNINEITASPEIKSEPINNEGNESDDELLSDLKKIKYEFIPIDNENETNEEEPLDINNATIKPRTQVCDECGKSVVDLKNHMHCHVPKDGIARVPCTLCDKTFSSRRGKYKHMKKIHLSVKKPCPLCNKVVKNLQEHTLRLHNSSKLRYECKPCGRRFITAHVRDTHMLTHTEERPYACDKCDKRFRQYVTLVHHKQQIHDKDEIHLCQYCSKTFCTIRYLQRHLRIHSTDRPYQCKQCDKAFKTSKSLKNHTYTHSEEKTYQCTTCDMSFAHPGYLRAHSLTHTREKQYPCKYCDVKFHRSDHRKRHEFTAHEKHLVPK